MIIHNIKFRTFDLGGHEAARQLWREYFAETSGVIYMVDAAERERFPEAKAELNNLLASDILYDVPFVILGNKIDLPGAASEDELRMALGITETYGKDVKNKTRTPGHRPIEIFMSSIVKQKGYPEAFNWLAEFL